MLPAKSPVHQTGAARVLQHLIAVRSPKPVMEVRTLITRLLAKGPCRSLVSPVAEQQARVKSVRYLMVQNTVTTAKRKNDVLTVVVNIVNNNIEC